MARSKIAVAGGTGRVGRHVVDVLEPRGHEVVAMSRSTGVDVITGEELRLSHGPVLDAVLASCAVPGVLAPVPWGDRTLMDGGKTLEIECDYCRKNYEFTVDQLRGLLLPAN